MRMLQHVNSLFMPPHAAPAVCCMLMPNVELFFQLVHGAKSEDSRCFKQGQYQTCLNA